MERINARQVIPCPCFDEKTKTDCPRRACGCQVTCPEWRDYLKARDELYKKRDIEVAATSAIVGHIIDRRVAARRDRMRKQRYKRRGQT